MKRDVTAGRTSRRRMFPAAIVAILAAFAGPAFAQSQTYQYPFQNPDLPTETRIDNLISLMTLDEKISCLSTNTRIPRLGISGTGHSEGLHGLSMGGPRTPAYVAPDPPAGAPKGTPAPPTPPVPTPAAAPGAPGAAPVGAPPPARRRFAPITTTMFPQSYGMGETWDPDLMRLAGNAEGIEARYIAQNPLYGRSSLIVMAPNSDIGRDPRWGRTEECYGEDPFFNGTMVVAYTKGLQGDDPKYWLASSLLKHFLANSNEDNRGHSSSDFDERLFREYYSVAFRMGFVDGGSRGFMAAYNSYNGIPCGTNPFLKDIAVNEWGEDGIICTDGGALRLMVTEHHYYPDMAHAAAGTIKAGITKYLEQARPAVVDALDQKLMTEADLDAVLRGNFRVLIKLGLLDPPSMVPYSNIGTGPAPWLSDEHKALAKRATRESIVLLKNQNNALPIDRNAVNSIAVIGPRANEVLLDWYSGLPPYMVTPLDGIKNKLGAGVTVRYASGYNTDEAVKAAASSDVVIVCVGNHPNGGYTQKWAQVDSPSQGREAVDRKSIDLEQEALVKRVYAANPKTVVVLISSFPFAINWSQDHVPAIVHMTHSSEEEGNALADVLFGDYNPGGRLVQTWPKSLAQLPPMMDYDIRHGRTYMYAKDKPLYPFGYGLSYTNFSYSHFKISSDSLEAPGTVDVSVDVKNTGKMAGDDVVEMYVKHLNSSVDRPNQELKGFKRVSLKPGETKTVTIPLKASQLAYWDVAKHSFIIEPDKVSVMIGRSSADVVASKTIQVHSTESTQMVSAKGE